MASCIIQTFLCSLSLKTTFILKVLPIWKEMSGLLSGASNTFNNCYYLDGIAGTTGLVPYANETAFVKTSTDPQAMTTAKVVAALNNYIELKGVLQEGDTQVDTTGWCKWVVGDDNLPILDFDTEWNGTTWAPAND